MEKKEILELKRRMKKDNVSFTRVAGCYVDSQKNKLSLINENFLALEEEDFFKYLEIAGKILSGKLGNNLLNMEFPLTAEEKGSPQQVLMALRASQLKDENLLDAFYDHVIDTYDYPGNYLIVLFHDAYDVMKRGSDNVFQDESEEVYEYLLCAICPVDLSKPGLSYHENEKVIGARIRDWVVGLPESGFLFPAFNDRSTDIHSTLFYTKNAKAPHTEFIENGLGCEIQRTSQEKKDLFLSLLGNAFGTEEEDDTRMYLLDINLDFQEILESAEVETDGQSSKTADENVMKETLEDAKVPEKVSKIFLKSYKDAFEGRYPAVDELIDEKLLDNSDLLLENRALKEENVKLNQEIKKQDSLYSIDQLEKLQKEYEATEKDDTFFDWLRKR